MNHRAKFDAVSFILGVQIRNRTNKQTNKITNSKRYIHTCPSGIMDNEYAYMHVVYVTDRPADQQRLAEESVRLLRLSVHAEEISG